MELTPFPEPLSSPVICFESHVSNGRMIRKSYHDWDHMSEFVLEFPDLSWDRLDASERDGNIHNRMKDVERISLPVRKPSGRISFGSNDRGPIQNIYLPFRDIS